MATSRKIFGKYRLIADIGHGGMADVYLAVAGGPAGVNKLLVVKQIRPDLASDPAFVTMFLDEARLAARLNHPNVVQTLEVGEESGCYFIAMEYLDGQPFSRLQSQAGMALSLGYRIRILIDVLEGLHHAHELRDFDGAPLNVVHRDATPHNVFVTYDGQVKVVDFGVAKAATSSGQTRSGVIKGKLQYMAPEQACGELVDRRADVFSVGVMLWEAASGQRMWAGLSTEVAIVHRLATGAIPPLPGAQPPELARIVGRALAVDPAQRYATAADMARDLERYLDQMPRRITNRDVGALVSEQFAGERARIQALISDQLAGLSLAATGSNPRLALLHPAEAAPTVVEQISEVRSPSSYTAAAAPSSSTLPPPPQPPAASKGAVIGGAFAVALLLGGLGASIGLRSAATAPSASAAPAREVELRVAVSPASARLFFDDAPLPANPHSMKLPADGRTHLIRAEADGHLPRVRSLVLDKDFSIEFSLDRSPEAQPASASAAPPSRTAAGQPGADGPPKKTNKGRRAVDPDNPYAQ